MTQICSFLGICFSECTWKMHMLVNGRRNHVSWLGIDTSITSSAFFMWVYSQLSANASLFELHHSSELSRITQFVSATFSFMILRQHLLLHCRLNVARVASIPGWRAFGREWCVPTYELPEPSRTFLCKGDNWADAKGVVRPGYVRVRSWWVSLSQCKV